MSKVAVSTSKQTHRQDASKELTARDSKCFHVSWRIPRPQLLRIIIHTKAHVFPPKACLQGILVETLVRRFPMPQERTTEPLHLKRSSGPPKNKCALKKSRLNSDRVNAQRASCSENLRCCACARRMVVFVVKPPDRPCARICRYMADSFPYARVGHSTLFCLLAFFRPPASPTPIELHYSHTATQELFISLPRYG